MLQKLVATIFSNDVLLPYFLVHSDHSPEVGTSANPQIADLNFYLRICEPNFLPQIFADLRWKN